MNSKPLYECIIVSKTLNDRRILAKNRDRNYKPVLEIVHEIRNGVEIAYLRDTITDWSEGMNEFGIGIVNTALMVGYDENEKKIVKKGGKPSKDGDKIRTALANELLKDIVKSAISYHGGIKGHTFISTPKHTLSIEMTSKHKPKFKLHKEGDVVRTNHGHFHSDAGYTDGDDYKSSKIRKVSAEKVAKKIDSVDKVLPYMRKKFYEYDSNLNMVRDTENMFTSSQLLLDLDDLKMKLTYRIDKVEKFEGITNKLPKGYTPKIKIEVTKSK